MKYIRVNGKGGGGALALFVICFSVKTNKQKQKVMNQIWQTVNCY